jgi:cell division protein FtsN
MDQPITPLDANRSLMTFRFLFQSCSILIPILLLQCSSTKEAEESDQQTDSVATQPPRPQFETRTDTVDTRSAIGGGGTGTNTSPAEIRFMVQIGAFKDPQSASQVQTITRERLHMPVFSDYNIALDLYQIRIGFFETYEAAQAFRTKVQTEFPTDYRDAWIVQLKR